MANIHLNRNRQSLGQFSPEEVAEGLQSGRFLPTDLGWTEGMASWKPLSEFSDLPIVAPPIPSVAPGSELIRPLEQVEPAWERRGELGFFPALFESLRDLLASTGKVFKALPTDNNLLSPLTFVALVYGAFLAVFLISNLLISLVNPAFLQNAGGSLVVLVFAMVVWYAVIVVATVVTTLVTAAIFHLILQVLGGANRSFATTFRVVSYSLGAASVLALLPLCGIYLVPIYQAILCIIGLHQAHRTEGWKATLVVVLPALLCCGLLIGGGVMLMDSISNSEVWKEFLREIEKQRR